MRIELAYISPRRQRLKSGPAQQLLKDFMERANRYTPTGAVAYDSEAGFISALDKSSGRTPAVLVLADSRGDNLSSEVFAGKLLRWRDVGTQQLVCAVGPADGWSAAALRRAELRIAFGAITLPHELALVVFAEQIYRALTIHAGHPYHAGHTEGTSG